MWAGLRTPFKICPTMSKPTPAIQPWPSFAIPKSSNPSATIPAPPLIYGLALNNLEGVANSAAVCAYWPRLVWAS